MRTVLALLAVLFVPQGLTSAPSGAEAISKTSFTLDQLRSDYQVVRNVVHRVNPLAFANREALETILDRQEALLNEGMGELEFYRVLAPVVASIQCGHTWLRLRRDLEGILRAQRRYLPFLVYALGDELYVLDPLAVDGMPAGARITSINGRAAKEILETLTAGVSSDGGILSRKYVVLNGGFNDQYLMLIESPERFTVQFVCPGAGAVRSVTADALSRFELEELSGDAGRPYVPRTLSAYQYSFPGADVASLTVRTFGLDSSHRLSDFQAFLGTFFGAVRDRGIHNLVVDLRGNWGGDPAASSSLYAYLIREPSPYFAAGTPYYGSLAVPLQPEADAFRGNLYVLTNGASFSSTGHLCSLLRFHGLATFIGEETGGTFTCTDGSTDILLPETHLVLRSSTKEFRTAVTGLTAGKGIVPDYEIVPTIQDVIEGRDAQMELAIRLADGNPP
jgi:hypothetical protein